MLDFPLWRLLLLLLLLQIIITQVIIVLYIVHMFDKILRISRSFLFVIFIVIVIRLLCVILLLLLCIAFVTVTRRTASTKILGIVKVRTEITTRAIAIATPIPMPTVIRITAFVAVQATPTTRLETEPTTFRATKIPTI